MIDLGTAYSGLRICLETAPTNSLQREQQTNRQGLTVLNPVILILVVEQYARQVGIQCLVDFAGQHYVKPVVGGTQVPVVDKELIPEFSVYVPGHVPVILSNELESQFTTNGTVERHPVVLGDVQPNGRVGYERLPQGEQAQPQVKIIIRFVRQSVSPNDSVK